MQSFHNDGAVKNKYVDRVKAHIKADHLVRGLGWDGKRGCAVGCTLENYEHSQYPVELGIPEWLARVEDTLFEAMAEKKSRIWPKVFLQAVPVGVSEEIFETKVKAQFMLVVLRSSLTTFDQEKYPQVKAALDGSIALWSRDDINSAAWSAAESAAESAKYDYFADELVKILKSL